MVIYKNGAVVDKYIKFNYLWSLLENISSQFTEKFKNETIERTSDKRNIDSLYVLRVGSA
jgi:hypothetical protein